MPASVGARPGTSVAAAAHSSAPKPRPMPANAAPSALRAARRLRSTATSSSTAIARPTTSPTGKPPVAAPSIGSPDIATSTPEPGSSAVASSRRSRALASRSVGRLVVADGRVGRPAVVGDARVVDRDDVRLRSIVGERAVDARRLVEAASGAEDDRGLRARLRGEPLLEQVLRLLGLDARDGEVVLERAADGDGAADDRRDPEEHDERGDPWAAADDGGDAGEEGGHGAALYTDSV